MSLLQLIVLFIISRIKLIFLYSIADVSCFLARKSIQILENPDHEI